MRLKPLLGATTQASESGRFRSLRKYSKTVGCWGGTRKVVEGLVDASGEAGGGDVVAEDAPIHYLGEEARLGDEFVHQVRNVFLPFGGEGFLVARAPAEGDDDDFSFFRARSTSHQGAAANKSTSQCQASRVTQEIAPAAAEMAGDFARIASGASVNDWSASEEPPSIGLGIRIDGLVDGAALAA